MLTKTIDVHTVQMSMKELLSLIRGGVEVIVTDASIPLARVTPLTSQTPTPRIAELHAGAIETRDDFDEPLPDSFWIGNANQIPVRKIDPHAPPF